MNKNDQPALSIITPCYNSEKYIKQAIKSVQSQDYDNFQHLIIDGESTDGTQNILAQYDQLDVISEPDQGIYDALNKGLDKAEGDLIGWLNADDKYADKAFKRVIELYQLHPECEMVAGSTVYLNKSETQDPSKTKVKFTSPSDFQRGKITHSGTKLNACFLSRELIRKVGKFDDSLKVAGDTEYLVRIAATKPKITRTEDVIMQNRIHDNALTHSDSNFSKVDEIRFREGINFMRNYLQRDDLPDPLYDYCLQDYRQRTKQLVLGYLRQGNMTSAMRTAITASQFDKQLPVWAISKAMKKIS